MAKMETSTFENLKEKVVEILVNRLLAENRRNSSEKNHGYKAWK